MCKQLQLKSDLATIQVEGSILNFSLCENNDQFENEVNNFIYNTEIIKQL